MKITVSPSIFAGNHAHLQASMNRVIKSGARWLHVDIMDGHFVPNLTFGSQTIQSLAVHKQNLFFDVHLMVTHPENFIESFSKAGADLISVHIESSCDMVKIFQKIRAFGKQTGIVVNPETAINNIFPYIGMVDLVLIMGIYPGFCGQKFIKNSLKKIEMVRNNDTLVKIGVDGGINLKNASLCIERGANVIVTGTSFFEAQDPREFVQKIEHE